MQHLCRCHNHNAAGAAICFIGLRHFGFTMLSSEFTDDVHVENAGLMTQL